MRFGHPALCARNSKQATINFNLSHWVGIRPAPYSLREVVSTTAKTLRTGPSPSRTSVTTRPSAWRYVKSLTAKPTVLSASFRAMVALGKVRGNLMIDLNTSSTKLRDRATRMVAELTESDYNSARGQLEASNWDLRAVLKKAGK